MSQIITVAGGNLFRIAAQYMGDATQAYRIAQANGNLSDYFLSGLTTLAIPDADASQTGGVPQQ